jgi:hypothetical protein
MVFVFFIFLGLYIWIYIGIYIDRVLVFNIYLRISIESLAIQKLSLFIFQYFIKVSFEGLQKLFFEKVKNYVKTAWEAGFLSAEYEIIFFHFLSFCLSST